MSKVRAYSKATIVALNLLGSEIKRARKERGWTEAQLAERVGISRTTLAKIEAGDLGCEVGLVFEAATLAGVPLFDPNPERVLGQSISTAAQLALLPKRTRIPARKVRNDF